MGYPCRVDMPAKPPETTRFLSQVRAVLRLRRLSPRTEETCLAWIRRYVRHLPVPGGRADPARRLARAEQARRPVRPDAIVVIAAQRAEVTSFPPLPAVRKGAHHATPASRPERVCSRGLRRRHCAPSAPRQIGRAHV